MISHTTPLSTPATPIAMTPTDIFVHNRVILTHFDTYSAALLFPRWDQTLLWPAALPASATPMRSPAVINPEFSGPVVRQAVIDCCGFDPDTLERVNEFNHWADTEDGPVRIHLLRFTTRDAPKAAIDALGGEFKPISLLRSSAMSELVLLREVFNLIVSAGVP